MVNSGPATMALVPDLTITPNGLIKRYRKAEAGVGMPTLSRSRTSGSPDFTLKR